MSKINQIVYKRLIETIVFTSRFLALCKKDEKRFS